MVVIPKSNISGFPGGLGDEGYRQGGKPDQHRVLDPDRESPGRFWALGHITDDQKSAGASDAVEAPVMIGGPSRARTLDPLIKSPDQDQSTETQDDLSEGNSDDHD